MLPFKLPQWLDAVYELENIMKNFIRLKTRADAIRNYDPDKRIDTTLTDIYVNIAEITTFAWDPKLERTRLTLTGPTMIHVEDKPEEIAAKINAAERRSAAY